jgi:GNAT superfamily N-acetyltransferase
MRVTRTYLQLGDPRQFRSGFGDFPDIVVTPLPANDVETYRLCYRTIGAAFHWRDRWDWTDDQIRTHLADPGIMVYVARRGEALAGYYELRRVGDDDSVEVAYFGIVTAELGRGFGKHLLSCAVRDAWALGPSRVWLHTCTLDHPNALPNYVARGFVPYKTEEYEVDSAA